jgi:hypothetical protein
MSDDPYVSPEAQPGAAEAPDKDSRMFAMLCHLLGIVTWFIGPMVIWLMKREDSSFVDDQGKEALNFIISASIVGIGMSVISMCIGFVPVIGMVVLLVIPLSFAFGIACVVLMIMGAVAANKGDRYRYPVNFRLIK